MSKVLTGYLCRQCNYFYSDKWGAVNCCAPDEGFGCSDCSYSTLRKEDAEQHIKKYHSEGENEKTT